MAAIAFQRHVIYSPQSQPDMRRSALCARPGGQPLSTKPGSVCLECPRIAVARGRCAVHQRAQRQAFDATRPSAASRGYGSDWRDLRNEILRQQPMCSTCFAVATEVHHSPRYVVGTNHRDYALTAMCKRCHSSVTSRQVR